MNFNIEQGQIKFYIIIITIHELLFMTGIRLTLFNSNVLIALCSTSAADIAVTALIHYSQITRGRPNDKYTVQIGHICFHQE